MSGSEAAKILARQVKAARAEARKAKQERQEAREAEKRAAIDAEQQRLVAEARAARESGAIPSEAPSSKWKPKGKAGKAPVLGERLVDDPYEPGAKMMAVTNLCEHPLEMMLARRRLERPLYEAGVRFRRIYEAAVIGPGRGIDPGHIKVDGGRMGDPLSDAVVHAHRELARILPALGKRGSHIVLSICGRGLTVTELAERYDGYQSPKQNVAFITLRLQEALEYLAENVWGAKGPQSGRIVGERGLGEGVVDDHAVEVANQTYLRKRGMSI